LTLYLSFLVLDLVLDNVRLLVGRLGLEDLLA
jgi:type III secretory pathway component EscR